MRIPVPQLAKITTPFPKMALLFDCIEREGGLKDNTQNAAPNVDIF